MYFNGFVSGTMRQEAQFQIILMILVQEVKHAQKHFQFCSNISATQDSELSVVFHKLLAIFQNYL